jgi:hypothetical protein
MSIQIEQAKLTDIKIGNTLMAWVTENGSRITTAAVIYIQGSRSDLNPNLAQIDGV